MGIVQAFTVEKAWPLDCPSTIGKNPKREASSKLLGLELLRFASALAVIFYHYDHFARVIGGSYFARSEMPFYEWLWPLYNYGQFGVEIFWGISGYIFFWKYGQAIHDRTVPALRFFWLRFSRLYPLHFATLILVAGLQLVHRQLVGEDYLFPADRLDQFISQLFLANNWGLQPSHSFNAPIWSVSAEIAVYAGFFLLLRGFAPSFKLCLAVVLAVLAVQSNGFGSVPLLCALFFFAGGMAAQLRALSYRWRITAGFIAVLVVAIADRANVLRDPALVPWVVLASLPFLLAALAGNLPGIDRWHRQIETSGNLTYSTYLLHFPLQLAFAVGVAATGTMPDATRPLFLVGYLGTVFVAGVTSYRAFELPAQRWIRGRVLHF